MSQSPRARIRVVLLAAMVGFTGLLALIPNVQAAVWTQTTDVDFTTGTRAGVEVLGTGTPAYVQLTETARDWRNEAPSSGPSARSGPAMAYDAARGVIVLFGGTTGTYQGDTWEYDPAVNTWTMTSSSGPPARGSAAVAYDGQNDVVVLFGGFSSTGARADTWEYDAGTDTWVETTPIPSPPTLGSYTMAYHASAQRSILVGANFASGSMVTWQYDAAVNAWQDRMAANPPSLRTAHALAYHAGLDALVLFGGALPAPPTVYGDTWEYDYGANSWAMTVAEGSGAPDPRTGHAMSFRPTDDSMLLFGGVTGSPTPDSWRYFDMSGSRTWQQLAPQRSPSARSSFGLADESADGKSVLFGGTLQAGGRSSETWSFGKAFGSSGTLTSQVFDSRGANADWTSIAWLDASQPPGTTLQFRIASGDSPTTSWIFRGPDGSIFSYYTASSTAIWSGHDNDRYLVFRAFLQTGDNLLSSKMDEVTITYDVPAASPYIVLTDPADADSSVPFLDPIFIRFSEPMDTSSVSWIITPSLAVTDSWSESNSALTLSHTVPFQECSVYTVSVSGMDTGGNPLVPNPVDPLVKNPWTFVTLCDNPEIVTTSPIQGAVDVPLSEPIVVDFSEPMDTATVTWTIGPSIPLSETWTMSNSRLTLSHVANFPQCTDHTVEITAGKDLAGLSLLPGPVPNPWSFKTVCTEPYLVSTDPVNLETNVAVGRSIVVTFSEPMNTATVTWTITPSLLFTDTWSMGNTVLTLNHATPFSPCTVYAVGITGEDTSGNPLIPGPAPNPWKFSTNCPNPLIVFTDPSDGETGVDLMVDILIVFSEPMDPISVTTTITPTIVLTPAWDPTNQILTLSHVSPFGCGLNTVGVSGQDLSGNALVPGFVPNPWSFSPLCTDPFIVSTDPIDGATGVALDHAIVVTFSEQMNLASLSVTIIPSIPLTPAWGSGDTVLTLSHTTPFAAGTQYVVLVAARDMGGNPLVPGPVPNPWSFTTTGVAPYIVLTDPADGATGVNPTSPIVVTFNEPMDTATVSWSILPNVPLVPSWTVGDTVLQLDHAPFVECVTFTVQITGRDVDGNDLVAGPVPNPWSFSTVCVRPFITNTYPADAANEIPLDAPIIVNFSEAMNTGTVNVLIAPLLVLTPTWTNGDQTLTLAHTADFVECTDYTVTASGRDADGNDLVAGPVPNPWSFRAFCAEPFVVSTVPADGEPNVGTSAPLVVTFSRAMDTATVTSTFIPSATATSGWSGGNTVLTLTPSPPLLECTLYQVLIAGKSAEGKDLVPGPAPNPWTFDTACTVGAPAGLQIVRVPITAIRLTWNAVPNADLYRVYESQDRLAPWPWAVLGTSTTPTFDAVSDYSDGLTHNYLVRAEQGTTEGPNSTMAAKIQMDVGFNAATSNVHWFSLPHRSPFSSASDIASELTSARIDVVGKWNPATQSPMLYYWLRGGWRGTDFAINAGDGLFIGSVSAFSWVLTGTDADTTLTFTLNPPLLGNVNWISLPYTSTYARASDLVIDIEGNVGGGANTKIVEVVKWDAATQTLIRFFWTSSGWTGTDFSLDPGDAVYFQIVSSFNWQPRLVTPEVP